MRALSVHQPWATFITAGVKQYETRSWKTTYRGPLAIHASLQRMNRVSWQRWEVFLKPLGVNDPDKLPYGAVLAVVDLVDIYHTETLIAAITPQERIFGNWEPGRYAWALLKSRDLPRPIPARGQRGLWEWECPFGGGNEEPGKP